MKQELKKSLQQDLRKAIQHNDSTFPRTQDQGNNTQKVRFEENFYKAEQAREEHQRRLAFKERTRQVEREAARAREKANEW